MQSEVLARGSAMPDELVTSIDGWRVASQYWGEEFHEHNAKVHT
jgi:hypothetical protein